MSLLIDDRRVVSMHYKLTDNDGNVLDSSEGAGPMIYLHGAGNIIPGLEKALSGKAAGDSLEVRVEPAEGYGEINPQGAQVISMSAFEGAESVEVGMAFEAQGADGSVQQVFVTKVDGDDVTIDFNHPLSGVVLNFDVQIVDVREATEEEIDHGHVHTGGHSH
jgi:FKBP-type peptidyl-prolyl cis-trans isomerase SlyD